jgi:hypothetical protein
MEDGCNTARRRDKQVAGTERDPSNKDRHEGAQDPHELQLRLETGKRPAEGCRRHVPLPYRVEGWLGSRTRVADGQGEQRLGPDGAPHGDEHAERCGESEGGDDELLLA